VRVASFALMVAIFFVSGLCLKTRELKAAFRRRSIAGTTWGLLAICAVTPTLGFAVRLIRLVPQEYITGLVVLLASPTTLGVGISMTQRSRGNVGLAIALTVISNAVGVAIMPLWLQALVGSQRALAKPVPALIAKLTVSNFVPTLVGKALRELSPKRAAPWADRNKPRLGVLSNLCLAVIILQNISGARDELLGTSVGVFFAVVALAIGYHALFLAVNWAALALLRVPAPEFAASLILASQKSAPVALTAIEFITDDLSVQGLLAVPCVLGQLGQVFMGHPITAALGRRIARDEEEEGRRAEVEREGAAAAAVAAAGDAEAAADGGVDAAVAVAGGGRGGGGRGGGGERAGALDGVSGPAAAK